MQWPFRARKCVQLYHGFAMLTARLSWGELRRSPWKLENHCQFWSPAPRRFRSTRPLWICAATGSKPKYVYQCEECGEQSSQWTGRCGGCQAWNTLKKVEVMSETFKGGGGGSAAVRKAVKDSGGANGVATGTSSRDALQSSLGHRGSWTRTVAKPQRLSEVLQQGGGVSWRLPLHGPAGTEISRVLGGGIVPGSLTLFSGDPGIGKSTMLLQIAELIASVDPQETASAEPGSPMRVSDAVLYITAEESVDQVSNRADRMGLTNAQDNIYLYSATQMSDILRQVMALRPRAVIVDSIQTVYLEEVTGSAGSISQVRECTTALMRLAKDQRIPIFVVGHVTKSGEVAGPKVLEHIVDTTLYMEGEHGQAFRLLRVNKNRFGKTDEIGVFSMEASGLQPVPNPSAFFLTDRSKPQGASSAISVTMGGSRPMLVEIQALCTPFHQNQGSPIRAQNGVQKTRMHQILAILQKYCKVQPYMFHIHSNVVGGFILTEPATDLAVAVALASSMKDKRVRNDIAFVGEMGLGGELRPISNLEKRVIEAAKLGFHACVVPEGSQKLDGKQFQGIEIITCENIREAIKFSLLD